MRLWLKCPVCQANNPLEVKVCSDCGTSMENLPPEQRVYILETASAPAPRLGPPPTPAAAPAKTVPAAVAPAAAPRKAKRPKPPKKKKPQA